MDKANDVVDIDIEKYERIKNKIHLLSYQDLVFFRNEMTNSGNDNNLVFKLIDLEIKKRWIGAREEKEAGRSK